MQKEHIQNTVALYKDRKLIILEHATGAGKSFSAIRVLENTKGLKVLLIVAEIFHKENWDKEFEKFKDIYGYDVKENDITVECYASLKNYRETKWDVIILDEVHHLSDLREEILSTIKTDKLIALSATLEQNTIDFLANYMDIKYGTSDYYYSKITLKNAIDGGILPDPKVYLIPLNLDYIMSSEELIITRGNKSRAKHINTTYSDMWHYMKNKKSYPDIRLIVKCTPKEKYDHLTGNIEYWKNAYMGSGNASDKNRWMMHALDRKRLLGSTKTAQVRKLLNRIKDMRYICFCNSIEQAKDLGGNRAIHSKNDNSKLIFEKFQNKEIDSIFVIEMLTEGQNLKDIDAGIIVQLDNAPRLYVQKTGRIFRSEFPIQFIFYYKDTQDEVYLRNVLNNIPNELIEVVDNINDI